MTKPVPTLLHLAVSAGEGQSGDRASGSQTTGPQLPSKHRSLPSQVDSSQAVPEGMQVCTMVSVRQRFSPTEHRGGLSGAVSVASALFVSTGTLVSTAETSVTFFTSGETTVEAIRSVQLTISHRLHVSARMYR